MDTASWIALDGALTLLAPAVAIGLSLATRRIAVALGAGTVVAAVVGAHGRPGDALRGLAANVVDAVWSYDGLRITAFTVAVAATLGVMGASGATRALVAALEARARGPRGAMVTSWLAGMLVFFDDYANCLVVGASMGPVCDRHGVSRAKLAYIVDSTAAPVASLAVVGTWVGFEVGLLDEALQAAGQPPGGGFALFLDGLPTRFYSLFALALVGLVAWTGRDFGPMVAVERAARGRASGEEGARPPAGVAWAAAPIVALVGVTLVVLVADGVAALDVPVADAPPYAILAGADAYRAMLAGGVVAFVVASAVAWGARGVDRATWWGATRDGTRTVVGALGVLYAAWALGNAIGDTEAQAFLASTLGAWLPAWGLPGAVFTVSAAVAFATGTSFGTMAIVIPLAVPLAMGADPALVAVTASAVLSGACLGDHASPISDTTVLSAAGAGCEVVEHVQTQAPYALLAGVVALGVGYVPAGLGAPWWLVVPAGGATCAAVLVSVGTPIPSRPSPPG